MYEYSAYDYTEEQISYLREEHHDTVENLREFAEVDRALELIEAAKALVGEEHARDWLLRYSPTLGMSPIEAALDGKIEAAIKLAMAVQYGSYV